MLANARLIAGVGGPYDLAHLSYYPGWSIVLAPIWWFTQDPMTAYRIAVLLTALCGIALIAPLAGLASRLGVKRPIAVILASVVAIAPSRTAMSGYTLSENALVLTVAITCWLAIRYAQSRSTRCAALLGAAAAFSFVVHGRMIPLLGAVLLWFAIEAMRGRRRAALVGLVTGLTVSVLGFALHLWTSATLYGDSGARESTALATLLQIEPRAFAAALVGQVWYVTVAWLALPLIGMWLLGKEALAELRSRVIGWATPLAIAVAGLGFISVGTISHGIALGVERLDLRVYGRYVEPLAVIVAMLGLVCLVRGVRRRVLAGVAGSTVVVVLVMQLWAVPAIPRGGWWAPINIPGLLRRTWPMMGEMWTPPWLEFGLVAVAVAVAYLAVRRWASLIALPLAIYYAVSSVSMYAWSLNAFNGGHGAVPDLVHVIEQVDPTSLSYDTRGADGVGQNLFQYWLTGRDVQVFDSRYSEPPTDLVVSRQDWWRGEMLGAVRIAGSQRDEALWVMPGALQRELKSMGALEPESPEEPLDVDFVLARDDGDDPDVPLRIGSDGRVDVTFEVTNLGETTWPALGTIDSALGTIRVVLWWTTDDGPVQMILDLPYTLLPGHTAEIGGWTEAPPNVVPGSSVVVRMVQEGVAEFEPTERSSIPVQVSR